MTQPIPGPVAAEDSAVAIPNDVKLIVTLMGASANQNNAINWALIQDLSRSERRQRAQLALIRDRVVGLMDGPYMPNPAVVMDALWCSETAVDEWLAEHYDDWRDPASPARRCWSCLDCRM